MGERAGGEGRGLAWWQGEPQGVRAALTLIPNPSPNPSPSPNPYPNPNPNPKPNPNPNPTQDFELRKLLAKLGIDEALAKKAGAPWTIQGGSFVMRNSAWSAAILETIFREAGSTLVLRAPWDWARLSDRAQWMRWVYHHPHEARKHMRLLPGRAFNSMGSDYAEGDLVLHAGGGGAFGLHVFGKDKYVELLRRCQTLEGDLALHSV